MALRKARVNTHTMVQVDSKKIAEFRIAADRVPVELLNRVRVFHARRLAEFDAVAWTLRHDRTLGVVVAPTGSIAAFRDGVLDGWHATVALAVHRILEVR